MGSEDRRAVKLGGEQAVSEAEGGDRAQLWVESRAPGCNGGQCECGSSSSWGGAWASATEWGAEGGSRPRFRSIR